MAKRKPDESKTGAEALGELVAKTRAEKNLSRYALARAAGIKEPTVRGIENGIAIPGSEERRWPAPTEDTLDRIALALGLDPNQLRSAAGKHLTPNSRSDTVKPIISKSIDASGLSDDEIEKIQALVNTIRSTKGTV
ncbi:helix-turn-helix domain-containing protein [Rhodococcus sp. NPDC055024]